MKFSRISLIFFIIPLVLVVACSKPENEKETHYQKALEYIKQDNNNAAIIELRNVVSLDAKFADAHYQLGLLYLKTNRTEKAFKSFHRTVSLNPDNLDAGIKLAEFYLLLPERRKKAVNMLNRFWPGSLIMVMD